MNVSFSLPAWEIDDQYLFRLASTFGWDDAMFICGSLVCGIETASRKEDAHSDDDDKEYYLNDYLIGCHRNQNEKSLQQWLCQAHTQLFYADQWGNCPLHAASYVKPPLDMIDALFRLGRAMWKHSPCHRGASTPLWATPSRDKSTPFLVACSTGASTAVLHRYLDEIEYYIDQKWVHPKWARLLVVQPDNQFSTPLMGWMVFHHGWIKRQLEQEGDHNISTMLNANNPSSTLSDYWGLACRMLLFATMNIHPHSPPSTPVLVHRCAEIAVYCPPSLLEWVVDPHMYMYNGEGWVAADLSAATTDNKLGKLPLHRAMEAVDSFSAFDEDIVHHCDAGDFDNTGDTATTMDQANTITTDTTFAAAETGLCPPIIYNNPKLEQNRVQIIKKLLQWYPPAAKTPFCNGRSPLVQAIVYGGTWHQIGYAHGGIDSHQDDSLGLLQLLWGHAPEQSLEVDPVTSLYPFMLAATIGQNDGSCLERDQDVVDTVYNLLRKDPQLVAGAVKN